MKILSRKYFFLFFVVFSVLVDQLVKYLIRYYDGFFICNKGISFGFILPKFLLYLILISVIIFSLLYLLGKVDTKKIILNKVGLTLVLGGGLSNLIDRFNYGCVIDFIDFKFFPVFNLADSFIFLGAIWIVWMNFKKN